jgi:hypothetical protein
VLVQELLGEAFADTAELDSGVVSLSHRRSSRRP